MCGRFALALPPKSIAEHFQLDIVPEFHPRFNIAPTQSAVTIGITDGVREAVARRWGLIPRWAKDVKTGAKMINARLETAAEKPAFREAFKHRRCLIPASGFFEWNRLGGGKEPYYIHPQDAGAMAFAGLFDSWTDGALKLDTFTILTRAAHEPVAAIHDRMPVILSPTAYLHWLDKSITRPEDVISLLETSPTVGLTMIRVGEIVNSAMNDDPRCIAPV